MGVQHEGKPFLYEMGGVNTHVEEHLRDFSRQAKEKPWLRVVSFQQGFQLNMIFKFEYFGTGTDEWNEIICKKYKGDMNAILEHEFGCRIVPQPHELEYRAFPPRRDLW